MKLNILHRKPKLAPVGIVQGWRQFYPCHYDSKKLEGQFGVGWETREHIAICKCSGSSLPFTEHVKDPAAQCGIYIVKEPPIVQSLGIYAVVTGWGLGYEHEAGWRMQYCRIEHFILGSAFEAERRALNLETPPPCVKRYNVPITYAPNPYWLINKES